jgi:hypothetical protein
MSRERWTSIAASIASVDGDSLCFAVRELLDIRAAAITLMSGQHRSLLCVEGVEADDATSLEDAQFTVGEGPTVDACGTGRVVEEPHLSSAHARWPVFVPMALEAGAAAVFAFPLCIGAARFGALTVYADNSGWLSPAAQADAVVMADALARRLVVIQAGTADDQLAFGLDAAVGHRAEIHQASGIVAVQLGIGIVAALVRLRAHAFATDRPLLAVAVDVVEGRLRL